MKIGEALVEKKKFQSRLAKCNDLLQKSYYYRQSKPDFSYKKIRTEIDDITKKIRKLKIDIQYTNMTETVSYKEKTITLAEMIILIGDIRAEIATIGNLYRSNADRYSFMDENTTIMKPQVPPEEIEENIKSLNQEKSKLDSLLQHTNWTIDLRTFSGSSP